MLNLMTIVGVQAEPAILISVATHPTNPIFSALRLPLPNRE
jgi:hypothetical protein